MYKPEQKFFSTPYTIIYAYVKRTLKYKFPKDYKNEIAKIGQEWTVWTMILKNLSETSHDMSQTLAITIVAAVEEKTKPLKKPCSWKLSVR